MAPLATPADVQRRWRPLSDAELPAIEAAIEDASSVVRRAYPTLDARIAAGKLTAAEAAGVVARMVIRGMKNPEGIQQEATGAVSATYSARVSAGYLYLAPEDIAILRVAKVWPAKQIQVGTPYRPYDAYSFDPNFT